MKNRAAIVLSTIVLMFSISESVVASTSPTVTIKNIQTTKLNTATVIISANHPNNPSCNFANRMIIDISTSSGRAMLAAAITAQMTGNTVKIVGTNACFAGGTTAEEMQMIMTYDY